MTEPQLVPAAGALAFSGVALTDDDVRDAMRRIPGYLDISVEDFRELYLAAQAHALGRLFQRARAGDLMLTGLTPLTPDMSVGAAARALVGQGRKGLPVVDTAGRVIGMFTETDLLGCQQVGSCLELLLRAAADTEPFRQACSATTVGDYMTAPAVTVPPAAGFLEIVAAFQRHGGRGMPVVDADGRLLGLLLRKSVVRAYHIEDFI